MTRGRLIALLVALLVGGVLAYGLWSRAPAEPQAAADCEDKPPPNEFAMAAECEGDEAPGPVGAPPDPEGGIRR